MQEKYTPGPWAIYRDHPESKDIIYVRRKGTDFLIGEVCIIYSGHGADAALIAAAPELLASLKEFVVLANFNADTIPPATEEWDAMVVRAESVVAKAECEVSHAV